MAKNPDIEEAIEILKASKIIKTHKQGGPMLLKIDEFFKGDQIVFDPSLPGTVYGESFENFIWGRIRLNTAWIGHPMSAAAAIAHEAVHLVSATPDRVEEELECRAFDAQFIAEIIAGITYTYPAGSNTAPMTAKMTSASPIWTSYQTLIKCSQNNQLIDQILALPKYAKLLKSDWVYRNYKGWGGLRNRWATSLGAFVFALVCADQRPAFYAPAILEVMEAIPASYWVQAKSAMPDFNRVQAMMVYIGKLPDPNYGARIAKLEKTFNQKLKLW